MNAPKDEIKKRGWKTLIAYYYFIFQNIKLKSRCYYKLCEYRNFRA